MLTVRPPFEMVSLPPLSTVVPLATPPDLTVMALAVPALRTVNVSPLLSVMPELVWPEPTV